MSKGSSVISYNPNRVLRELEALQTGELYTAVMSNTEVTYICIKCMDHKADFDNRLCRECWKNMTAEERLNYNKED